MNAWTLEHTNGNVRSVAVRVGTPAVELDHVLAGVGAVGSALLLTLWSYPTVSGTIRAVDADKTGVDLTNLNRCLPFGHEDLEKPKAEVAAARLSGRHGLVIEPTFGRAEELVGPQTHLISAVDTPEARQALQDKYPRSAVQASTEGLRLEVLRVDPTAGTACLRCFNPPRAKTTDAEIRSRLGRMDEGELDVHARAVGVRPEEVRDWARVGGCGLVGEALLDRLRASDGSEVQFSVGFVSVLAGVLLAAQVIKDSVRRTGGLVGNAGGVPLEGAIARFVLNVYAPSPLVAGARHYLRDTSCPACGGVRSEIWTVRWTG